MATGGESRLHVQVQYRGEEKTVLLHPKPSFAQFSTTLKRALGIDEGELSDIQFSYEKLHSGTVAIKDDPSLVEALKSPNLYVDVTLTGNGIPYEETVDQDIQGKNKVSVSIIPESQTVKVGQVATFFCEVKTEHGVQSTNPLHCENFRWENSEGLTIGETGPNLDFRTTHCNIGKSKIFCEVTVNSRKYKTSTGSSLKVEPYRATDKIAILFAFDEYHDLEYLPGPRQAVCSFTKILKCFDFNVFVYLNLTKEEMMQVIDNIEKIIIKGSYVLFYFSGHGFILSGEQYLRPIDASDRDLVQSSIPLNVIYQMLLSRNPSLLVLMLDTCRTEHLNTILNGNRLQPASRQQLPYVVTCFPASPNQQVYSCPVRNNTILMIAFEEYMKKFYKTEKDLGIFDFLNNMLQYLPKQHQPEVKCNGPTGERVRSLNDDLESKTRYSDQYIERIKVKSLKLKDVNISGSLMISPYRGLYNVLQITVNLHPADVASKHSCNIGISVSAAEVKHTPPKSYVEGNIIHTFIIVENVQKLTKEMKINIKVEMKLKGHLKTWCIEHRYLPKVVEMLEPE